MLTRRPIEDPHRAGWHVYFGDVRVGHISMRAGVPTHLPQWGWSCGFYPGCEPGQQIAGSAETFEEARAAFEQAWSKLASIRTEQHFEEWRRDRDWTAWKYRMWEKGCRMPTQNTNGRSRCFCGAEITIACEEHIHTVHRGIGS
ncbi:hypothetical protein [Bradyrhizobium sp. SZCCHNS3053]|uniref:hypothetical protein n=1 Tax=Bradyrhizobium sp. SZCCHNS3053 TaxID=3057322 RepID=UPI002916AECB|nr:hypothetical protein [Bradyrhizobium sp. SZCCHNS3053]